MIESIKCKLNYLKNYKISIIAIFLSAILFFEILCLYLKKINLIDNENAVNEAQDLEHKKELKEIVEDFTSKKLDIISIEKVENSYNIEVSIKGRKDDILESFRSLKDYKIVDFEFTTHDSIMEGKVVLCYK